METTALDWLARLGSGAFSISLAGFLVVNGAAIAAVFVTRDRTLVNRWTGRLLATNLLLVGTGLGVPLLTSVARLAISVVSPTVRVNMLQDDKSGDQVNQALIDRRVGRP